MVTVVAGLRGMKKIKLLSQDLKSWRRRKQHRGISRGTVVDVARLRGLEKKKQRCGAS